jgi:hypothetical protein
MVQQVPGALLVYIPSAYHNRSGRLFFAYGHCQIKKWLDPRTMPPMLTGVRVQQQYCPNNPDVGWLQSHTTGIDR